MARFGWGSTLARTGTRRPTIRRISFEPLESRALLDATTPLTLGVAAVFDPTNTATFMHHLTIHANGDVSNFPTGTNSTDLHVSMRVMIGSASFTAADHRF